jgi:hypothetical protein
MKTRNEILEAAGDFSTIEITHGINGYPQGLGDIGVVGFDNFEEAEDFARLWELETHLFKKRDGWQLWEDAGRKFESLTYQDYLKDLGDNYSESTTEDYSIDTLKERISEDLEEAAGIIANAIELRDEVACCPDDEVVLVNCGKYFETVSRQLMSYHEDVWTYTVGVLIPKR